MSATRGSLVQILEQEFKDEKIRDKCHQSSRARLEKKDYTRVLDGFPNLLPKAKADALANEFALILINRKLYSRHAFNKYITRWGVKIARIGCAEMLDQNLKINPKLIELLGWDKQAESFNDAAVFGVVSSFLCTTYAQTSANLYKLILKFETAYHDAAQIFNEQSADWVQQAFVSLRKPAAPSDDAMPSVSPLNVESISLEDLKAPRIPVTRQRSSMFSSGPLMAAFGSAAALGILMYKSYNQSEEQAQARQAPTENKSKFSGSKI